MLRDSAGRVLGGVETFRDISEVRVLRGHLEGVARLRSLAIIAAAVAHEIRNPLACIRVNLEDMRENVAPDFAHIEQLDETIIDFSRANDIIKRLVEFATPDKRRGTTVDVAALVDSLLGHLALPCRRNKVRIDNRATPGLPRCAAGPDQLRTALLNIMLNSVEAMPAGGTLRVETTGETGASSRKGLRGATPDAPEGWQFVKVIIQDAGTGIRREHISHVFGPFFSSKDNGMGVVLSVAHQAIEQHGGIVDIKSDPGSGTCVAVKLPVFGSNALRVAE